MRMIELYQLVSISSYDTLFDDATADMLICTDILILGNICMLI
jgi:hypothetical protein